MTEGLHISYVSVIPPILGFFVLTGLSLLSIVRGGRKPTNLLFAAICFMGALINADVALVNLITDKELAIQVDRFTYVVFVFSLPIYIQFVHYFLGIRKRRWLEYGAYGCSAVFLVLTPTDLFIKGFATFDFGIIAQAGKAFHFFSVLVSFTVCYCLYTLFMGMKETRDNQKRNRIKYILWGLGLSSLIISLNILPVSGFNIYPMGNFSFIPAIVLAFGVLKYDLLDMGAVIRRGTIYFLLTIIMTIVYVLIIAFFNALFIGSSRSHPLLLPFLLALFMVLLFNPLRDRVRLFIDRLFFRGKYDYRQLLKDVSGQMTRLLRVDELTRLLLVTVATSLQPTHVRLYLGEESSGRFRQVRHESDGYETEAPEEIAADHPLVGCLERWKRPLTNTMTLGEDLPPADREAVAGLIEKWEAALILPMYSKDKLIGILNLGQKKSGELYVHEDLELLATLANQSATALENARMYEELARLNRELERKVEERTADLRQALAEKERTQEQLIRSESLAAIGQLVAGTAHELNNPLASASSLLQSSAETIRDWPETIPEREDVIDDLLFSLKELKRAGDIVRSLLGLSRQTQTYVEPVDINRAVDDALRVLFNQFKNLPVVIEKDYEEALPPVEGNFANLGQVFINIIKNALQSLPEGRGTVTLATRYIKERDTVHFTCHDTGEGIAAVRLKDIFKPFFTTKPVGKGTGLGLYISHEIIRRHGGDISAASEEGKGSTFVIELPCKRREQ
ncbi:MAG: GAF domain-containing protein [Syntrophobacterales bacterium]|nr:GAF domain-containing protein [Syntrophobacterales bacterium]